MKPGPIKTPGKGNDSSPADSKPAPPHSRLPLRITAGLLVAVLLAGGPLLVLDSERRSRDRLEARFHLRVELAEVFLHSFVEDVLHRERRTAIKRLSAAEVSTPEFDTVVEAFALEAAVLTDSEGKLLAVYPARPEILGSNIRNKYRHIDHALRDGTAVSPVVRSASKSAAIVAFATRFHTPAGARVFSGGWDLSRSPLRSFLENVTPMKDASAEIVDVNGSIVASSQWEDASARPEGLAMSRARIQSGASGGRRYAVVPVRGTPWRLVVSVSESALYSPVNGVNSWLPWLLLGGLSACLMAGAFLLVRLIESRAELRVLNGDLDQLARSDRLTNVWNRRHLEEELERCKSAARRTHQDLSVLLIDIDFFKRINDDHGHDAGDQVLRLVAGCLSEQVRVGDTFGRWGGEEFLAILPGTSEAGALVTAERMRTAAEAQLTRLASGQTLQVTVSIGCANATGAWDRTLLKRADDALYEAKAGGRNRVVMSPTMRSLALVKPFEGRALSTVALEG